MRTAVANLTKKRLPRLPLQAAKDAVLGKDYSLSVAFVDSRRSRLINKSYRGKEGTADVLAFPLAESEGEIILCPRAAEVRASLFGLPLKKYLHYLFIHALLHLKGYTHGSKMISAERVIRKKINF
ncbi:MAG: rRNA maturation RNase YbeY [Candidatus Taylorbacteria bacterium]|nr:rRNA maturation RNase YbeY [Candidatus Taylorbacteria bacterium]